MKSGREKAKEIRKPRKARKLWGFCPVAKAHSSRKGDKGYSRKKKGFDE